jgi:hypothetical protein
VETLAAQCSATSLWPGYAAFRRAKPDFDNRAPILPPITHEDLRQRAEECERLGRENGLRMLWGYLAPVSYGMALIRQGKVTEGIALLRAASWHPKRAATGSAVRIGEPPWRKQWR